MTAERVSSTQTALDEMVAGIAGRKQDKATQLTPVGTEKRTMADNPHDPALAFPYDNPEMTQQAVRDALKLVGDLKHHLDFVGKGLIELARAYGLPEEGIPAPRVPVTVSVIRPVSAATLVEVGHDPKTAIAMASADQERFEEEMARKAAAAQAATFDAAPVNTYGTPEEPKGDGWECPTHGADDLIVLTSRRRGRQYRACKVADCGKFEP